MCALEVLANSARERAGIAAQVHGKFHSYVGEARALDASTLLGNVAADVSPDVRQPGRQQRLASEQSKSASVADRRNLRFALTFSIGRLDRTEQTRSNVQNRVLESSARQGTQSRHAAQLCASPGMARDQHADHEGSFHILESSKLDYGC